MTTYSSVACSAEANTEQWEVDDITGKITASVVLRCDGSLEQSLVADLLVNNRVCPFVPYANKPVALRTGVTYETLDPDTPSSGQSNLYQDALVTVQYGFWDVEESGGGFKVSDTLEPQTDTIPLDHRRFRWGSQTGAPLTPEEAPGRVSTRINLVRKIFGIPGTIPFTVLSKIGRVNEVAYTSPTLGFTFAAETLLYLDPKLDKTIESSGTPVTNYTQVWAINPNNWNMIWRAETGQYERIWDISSGTAHDIYTKDSFADILF